MSAHDSMRLDDFRQRLASGETLSANDTRTFDRLYAQGEREHEAEGAPQWLGGDYPDL